MPAHVADETKHLTSATKTTPLDADALAILDSADSNKLKRLSFANLKSALTNVFAPLSHSHAMTKTQRFVIGTSTAGWTAKD